MFLAVNIFFFAFFLRLKAAKTKRAHNVAAAILIAGAVGLLALTAANPTMLLIYIPIVTYYAIMFHERMNLARKFLWSMIPFHFLILILAPHLFAGGAIPWMSNRALVGLHFFNFFYSFPFMIISKMGLFHGSAFENVVGEFVSRQALFGFRHAPGMTLLACMGFSRIVMSIFRRYVPDPGEQGGEIIRFPLWATLAGIPTAILFYLPTRITLLMWISAVVWPVCMSLMAMQGIILSSSAVSRRDSRGFFAPIAIFVALLSRHAMFFFTAVGALDLLFGLGFAMRTIERASGDQSEIDISNQHKQGNAALSVFALLIVFLITAPLFIFRGAGHSLGIPNMPDAGTAATYRRTSNNANRVTIAGPEGAYWIDKYEYPNKPGQLPLTGVDISEARDRCKATGGRLCSPLEWSAACMSGDEGYEYYLMKKRNGAQELISAECRSSLGGAVAPNGARKKCKNEYDLHDMMGNAWEMVEIPGMSGMIGFMGQGEGSGYEVLNQCNWLSAVYENQADVLPKGNIGFRCCGTASRTSNEGM